MNYKDEMIEEMARIICKETSNEGLCEKCDFKKHEQFGFTYQCRKFDDAEALYNANCRIIADDEIVIKKDEYMDFLSTRLNELKKHSEFIDGFSQGYEQAKRETARKILKWMDEPFTDKEIRKLITEKYGIE